MAVGGGSDAHEAPGAVLGVGGYESWIGAWVVILPSRARILFVLQGIHNGTIAVAYRGQAVWDFQFDEIMYMG